MSKPHIERLRAPKPRYDLAKLMPREVCPVRSKRAGREIIVGFETKAMGRNEDAKRADLSKAALGDLPALLNERWVRDLLSALSYGDGEAPSSRASSLRSRDHRRRLVGAILRLIDKSGLDVRVFTLLSQGWIVPSAELCPDVLRRVRKRLRNDIERLCVPSGQGFVIASIDGEYDEAKDAFMSNGVEN